MINPLIFFAMAMANPFIMIPRFIPRLQRGSLDTAFPLSRPLPAVKRNVRRSPPAGRSKDDGPVITVSCYSTAHAICLDIFEDFF